MKNINLIVTGGIAASKARTLYDLLSKSYKVNLVLTKNAKKFMDCSDLEYTDEIFQQEHYFNNHILGDHLQLVFTADLSIVYPASYNYLGKIASGIADDMPSLLFAASKAPVLLFPSMNFNMYENQILKKNQKILAQLPNVQWFEAKVGRMASGHEGIGRALEPDEVEKIVNEHFLEFKKFGEMKLLLNLGKTRSQIDAVRYITNASTGKMGKAIRDQALFKFKTVQTVFGDNDFNFLENETCHYAQTNEAMLEAMLQQFDDANIVICSAALYDFEVPEKLDTKIEKRGLKGQDLKLDLKPAIDVLYQLGQQKTHQFLVGFSLANDFDLNKAWIKVEQKNLDMLVVNLTNAIGATTNEIKILLTKNKQVIDISFASKEKIALEILKVIHKHI